MYTFIYSSSTPKHEYNKSVIDPFTYTIIIHQEKYKSMLPPTTKRGSVGTGTIMSFPTNFTWF